MKKCSPELFRKKSCNLNPVTPILRQQQLIFRPTSTNRDFLSFIACIFEDRSIREGRKQL